MNLQKMKRFLKSAAVALVTAAMCFGAVSPVMAEPDTNVITTEDSIKIVTNLTVATGVTVPDIDYEYTFTPISRDGDNTETELMPKIDGDNVVAVNRPTGDKNVIETTVDLVTPFTSAGAGVYIYEISETKSDLKTPDDTYTLTDDTTKYTMAVYVTNKTDGGTEITGIGIVKGAAESVVDQNGEGLTGKKLSQIDYTNTLTRTGGETDPNGKIMISKKVEGALGDKTKSFTFEFSLGSAATGVTDENVEVTVKGSGKWGEDVVTAEGIRKTLTYNSLTEEKIYLTDGQSVEISGLPYGTTFTIKEVLDNADTNNYITSVVESTTASPDETNRILENAVLDDTIANDAAFTNKHNPITPTGFLIDNMPFILLIVVGVAGIGAYMVSRRRRYQG